MMEAEKPGNNGGCAETGNGSEELNYLKQFHDEAYLYIEQALTCEENRDEEAALILYERGLRLIDQALSIQTSGPNCTGAQWQKAHLSQRKMRETRQMILESLERLRSVRQSMTSSFDATEGPPSYEEAVSSTQWSNASARHNASGSQLTLQEKVSQINTQSQEFGITSCLPEVPVNATEIFSLPEVQIFFVSTDGFVTAPSYPTSLIVYRLTEQQEAAATSQIRPTGILQVGDWIYPLRPGCTPVLQSDYGAYMFPNIEDPEHPGAAVGILLPDNIDAELKTLFEHLMCELTALQSGATISEETLSQFRLSRRLSDGLIKGAELLAKGIGYGAEQTAKLVHFGAAKLRENMKIRENVEINPKVNTGLKVVRSVSHVAVGVSSCISKAVGHATMALGNFLAPHVRHHGTKLLSKALKEDHKNSSKKIDSMLEVAAGGLQGFATVYISLESAARILATSLANETVQIVEQRYGPSAADTTGNALYSIGNTAMTVHNLNVLGIKGLAKNTAKNTCKALVDDYKGGSTSQGTGEEQKDNSTEENRKEKKRLEAEQEKSSDEKKEDDDDCCKKKKS